MLSLKVIAADTSLALTPQIKYFYYQEFDATGAVLDTERGLIPGISATALYDSGHWLLQGRSAFHRGTVSYHGQTQLGNPHRTQTIETMYELDIQLGWKYTSLKPFDSLLSLKYGGHRWERDILENSGVAGLYEVYTWRRTTLSVQQTIASSDQGNWLLAVGILRTHKGTMSLDLSAFGAGKPLFHLGARNGFESSLSYHVNKQRRLSYKLQGYYQQWGFGRSDIVAGFYEPESDSYELGLRLHMEFKQ